MPELPEVETIRITIGPRIIGRCVTAVDVRRRDLRRPLANDFEASLRSRRIEGSARRGKYLVFSLDCEASWIVHLGMSGTLVHREDGATSERPTHEHVVVSLDDGTCVAFRDPRRFGLMLVAVPAECAFLSMIGPEPLDAGNFSAEYLASCRARTRRTVKEMLMDQRVVAGLGNIYVNEILYLAGIRPSRRMPKLSLAECATLVTKTREVLEDAIAHRGSSISDFLDGVGRRGGYQWRRWIYDRAGEPCPRCSRKIRMRVIGQRSTYYCPGCQR